MQLSQIPTLVPLPFANSGTKNTIPTASQIGITARAASLTDGFPPLTFTPLTAGGVPPSGADFNGILNLLSANTQWENAGGFYTYNATFSTAIGGYPRNSLLAKASGVGYWLASVDNLATDPDTGGVGWIDFSPSAIQGGAYTSAADSGSANLYAITLTPAPLAITPGMTVGISAVVAANTGASTFNLNALGALPIHGPGGAALQGGEFVAGGNAILRANATATAFDLVWTTGAQPTAAATYSNQTPNLGQLFIGNRKAVFSANGNWTVPAGVTQIWVSGVGGGGGGGGGNTLASGAQGAGGGGGFSGAVAIKNAIAVTPEHSLAIGIGAGGAGGVGVATLANAGSGVAGAATTLTDSTTATQLLSLSGGVPGAGATVYQTNYVYGGTGFDYGTCLQAQGSTSTTGQIGYGGCGQGNAFGSGGSGGYPGSDRASGNGGDDNRKHRRTTNGCSCCPGCGCAGWG